MTFLGCIPDLPHSHDLETFQGIFFAFYKEDTEKRLILIQRLKIITPQSSVAASARLCRR